jgi:hypothetical protein
MTGTKPKLLINKVNENEQNIFCSILLSSVAFCWHP